MTHNIHTYIEHLASALYKTTKQLATNIKNKRVASVASLKFLQRPSTPFTIKEPCSYVQ